MSRRLQKIYQIYLKIRYIPVIFKKRKDPLMKNQYLPLVLLCCVVLAGCGGKKGKKNYNKKGKQEVMTQLDIDTASEASFFFDDITGEFAELDDNVESGANIQEFTWLEEDEDLQEGEFKVVHFDFDKASIREDQEGLVAYNIDLAKDLLEDEDEDATIVIDGHSCNSAGSRAYNLALSEQRAKTLRDRFVAEGVPANKVKIVARGAEVPAVVNGKAVIGDRSAQAPNRRDEIRVIYS